MAAPPISGSRPNSLAEADHIGLRSLGIPEQYGGVEVDRPGQTFSIIAEELARGDSGLIDELVQGWKISVLLPRRAGALQDIWFPRDIADPSSCSPTPDRTPRCLRPLAALQRPRGHHADRAVREGDELDLERPQAVHQQRLRRAASTSCTPTPTGVGDAAGHVQLPGPARHPRPRDRPVQRDDRQPLHEQRRDRSSRTAASRRTICWPRATRWARRAATSGPGKIIQAAKNLGVGVAASRTPPRPCSSTSRAAGS